MRDKIKQTYKNIRRYSCFICVFFSGMYKWDITFRCRLFGRDETSIDDPVEQPAAAAAAAAAATARYRYHRAVRFSDDSSSSASRRHGRHNYFEAAYLHRHDDAAADRKRVIAAMYRQRKAIGRVENDLIRSAEI